jgi:hydrogenase maturation protein HypF
VTEGTLDFRPLLDGVVQDRIRGKSHGEIARAFHSAVANAICEQAKILCEANGIDLVVLSGGVFQNELLTSEICSRMGSGLEVWMNTAVPPNDGGISLGQAATAALKQPFI